MSDQEIMSILRAFVHERVLDKLLDNKQPSAPTCGFYDAYTLSQCETKADYERKMIELNKQGLIDIQQYGGEGYDGMIVHATPEGKRWFAEHLKREDL